MFCRFRLLVVDERKRALSGRFEHGLADHHRVVLAVCRNYVQPESARQDIVEREGLLEVFQANRILSRGETGDLVAFFVDGHACARNKGYLIAGKRDRNMRIVGKAGFEVD